MGDPRRLRKKYETPRKTWDAARIEEDRNLLIEYGLRSMHELWTMESELKKLRRSARRLLALGASGQKEAQQILDKATRLGLLKSGASLDDLLSLSVRDVLERRLQTLVFKKGLALSMKQSRQLITHGFISVAGRKVTSPSYLVGTEEENQISYYKAFDFGGSIGGGKQAG
ncbi:MAG: 30S ribosomal protein S4 [Candidatus Micrarchaeia archaeon]